MTQDLIGAATPYQAMLRVLHLRVDNQVFMMSFSQLLWIIGIIFMLSFIPLIRLKLRYRPERAVAAH